MREFEEECKHSHGHYLMIDLSLTDSNELTKRRILKALDSEQTRGNYQADLISGGVVVVAIPEWQTILTTALRPITADIV